MITREEAVEAARDVVAGKTRSYVEAAKTLARYVMQVEDRIAPFIERPRDEELSDE